MLWKWRQTELNFRLEMPHSHAAQILLTDATKTGDSDYP